MPYGRRRRRSTYRRSYRGRRTGGRQPGRGERKRINWSITSAVVPVTGVILKDTTVGIVQGTSINNRTGHVVRVVSWHMRWHCLMTENTTVADNHDEVALYIYLDTQTNGATAQPGDIIETGSGSMAFRNLDNRGRFRILAKRKIRLYATAALGDGTTNHLMFRTQQGEIDLNMNLKVIFKGSTSAVGELNSTNIGIMAISEHGLARIHFHGRTRYLDS